MQDLYHVDVKRKFSTCTIVHPHFSNAFFHIRLTMYYIRLLVYYICILSLFLYYTVSLRRVLLTIRCVLVFIGFDCEHHLHLANLFAKTIFYTCSGGKKSASHVHKCTMQHAVIRTQLAFKKVNAAGPIYTCTSYRFL